MDDTDAVVEKIKSKLLEYDLRCKSDYVSGELRYLIYEFMIITYSPETNIIDVCFNVATRPDVAASISIQLSKLHNFEDINIMDVYSSESDGQILIGNTCIQKHQEKEKERIIKEYLLDQYQTHYLKNNQFGEMC